LTAHLTKSLKQVSPLGHFAFVPSGQAVCPHMLAAPHVAPHLKVPVVEPPLVPLDVGGGVDDLPLDAHAFMPPKHFSPLEHSPSTPPGHSLVPHLFASAHEAPHRGVTLATDPEVGEDTGDETGEPEHAGKSL